RAAHHWVRRCPARRGRWAPATPDPSAHRSAPLTAHPSVTVRPWVTAKAPPSASSARPATPSLPARCRSRDHPIRRNRSASTAETSGRPSPLLPPGSKERGGQLPPGVMPCGGWAPSCSVLLACRFRLSSPLGSRCPSVRGIGGWIARPHPGDHEDRPDGGQQHAEEEPAEVDPDERIDREDE